MLDTKTPWSSIGIMGPLITMIVYGLNKKWPGAGITGAEVAALIDQAGVWVAGVLAIYGRWAATKQITMTGR